MQYNKYNRPLWTTDYSVKLTRMSAYTSNARQQRHDDISANHVLSPLALHMMCLHARNQLDTSSRFDTIPACERGTTGIRCMAIAYRASMVSRGKNLVQIVPNYRNLAIYEHKGH